MNALKNAMPPVKHRPRRCYTPLECLTRLAINLVTFPGVLVWIFALFVYLASHQSAAEELRTSARDTHYLWTAWECTTDIECELEEKGKK